MASDCLTVTTKSLPKHSPSGQMYVAYTQQNPPSSLAPAQHCPPIKCKPLTAKNLAHAPSNLRSRCCCPTNSPTLVASGCLFCQGLCRMMCTALRSTGLNMGVCQVQSLANGPQMPYATPLCRESQLPACDLLPLSDCPMVCCLDSLQW